MPIFEIKGDKATKLATKSFKNHEKGLQKLIEKNLLEMLNCRFIASEYPTTHGGRIDTLALDENNSPVLIEFKEHRDENVISQGLFYLHWLLDHKAEFEKEVEKVLNEKIKVDWSQPRLITIAESYKKYDLFSIALIGVPVELKKYRIYENNILLLEDVELPKTGSSVLKKKIAMDVKEKIPQATYSLESHLRIASEGTKKIFYQLKEGILDFDSSISENIKKHFIAYKTPQINFVWLHMQKNAISIDMRVNKPLSDPYKIAKQIPEHYRWGKNLYRFKISNPEQIDAAINLIRQAYETAL